jgi:WD40 repeat protein
MQLSLKRLSFKMNKAPVSTPSVSTPSVSTPSVSTPSVSTPIRQPQLVRTILGHESWIFNLAFSLRGQYLASSSYDSTIRLWDWLTPVQNLRIDANKPGAWFTEVNFSPDGRTLVARRSDGTIQLRNSNTGDIKITLPERSNGTGLLAIAANNQTLVDATSLNGNFRIKLWNLDTLENQTLTGSWANYTAITPDGYILVAASSNSSATIWNLLTGRPMRTLPRGATEGTTAIAIHPNGTRILIARDGQIEQWSSLVTPTVNPSATRLLSTQAEIKALAISPGGQLLAISFGNYIQIRDFINHRRLYNLPCNATGRQVMAFSPNGLFFLNTDGEGDRIRVWQLP